MPFVQNFPFFSIFLPFSCGVLCLLLRGKAAQWVNFICLAVLMFMSGALLAFTLETGSFTYIMGHFPSPFANEIRAGPLEAIMVLLLCCISLFSLAGGLRDISRDIAPNKINFYFLMHNLLNGAMIAILYTNDFFTGFVFIEIVTISVCALIMIKPGGPSLAATIVYLVISLISSCLILFSIAMIYGVTGHLLFPGLQAGVAALAAAGEYTMPLFVFAGLITVGIAIKCAIFPFQGWLPNAYTSATTASSAVMSGFVTKCYFLFYIKIIYRLFGLEIIDLLHIHHLLLALGTAGILYGSIKALGQRNTKRMLSYASIVQAGCISLVIGLNTPAAMGAVCFHIIIHAIGKAMLFITAGGLAAVSDNRNDYDSLRGAARRDPLSGAAFLIAVLSMIGIPPFPGFFSKLFITQAAVETPFAVLVILAVIMFSTLLSAMYFFPALGSILSKNAINPGADMAAPPKSYRAVVIAFILLTLFLSVFNQEILKICEQGLAVFG